MINRNRIVPITAVDLISMYGLILLQNSSNSALAKLESTDVLGDYTVSASGTYLADQPIKTVNFTATSGTVFFVAGYDYKGFSLSGTAVTPTVPAEGILADGRTLYKAVLASGAVTITKVGF